MKNLTYFTIALAIFLIGCGEDIGDPTTLPDPYKNSPVIVNTIDTYTFTLNADNFSLTRSDSLFIESDSLVATLTIGYYTSGDGEIAVLSADSSQLFYETLNGNKVIVQTDITNDKPKKFHIQLSDFTGSLSFVLAAGDTTSN